MNNSHGTHVVLLAVLAAQLMLLPQVAQYVSLTGVLVALDAYFGGKGGRLLSEQHDAPGAGSRFRLPSLLR